MPMSPTVKASELATGALPPKDWRSSFGKRLASLRDCATGVFDRQVEQEVVPAFRELAAFLATGGFDLVEDHAGHNLHSFRLGFSPDLFVDVIFDLRSPCEVECYHVIHSTNPARCPDDCGPATVPLADLSEGWARARLQLALEALLRTAESLLHPPTPPGNDTDPAAEPATA